MTRRPEFSENDHKLLIFNDFPRVLPERIFEPWPRLQPPGGPAALPLRAFATLPSDMIAVPL
jgi:hypothetical protein